MIDERKDEPTELSDQTLSAAAGSDSLAEFLATSGGSDGDLISLQQKMDNFSRAQSAQSNTLKKLADTNKGIIQNLK